MYIVKPIRLIYEQDWIYIEYADWSLREISGQEIWELQDLFRDDHYKILKQMINNSCINKAKIAYYSWIEYDRLREIVYRNTKPTMDETIKITDYLLKHHQQSEQIFKYFLDYNL